MKPTRGFLKNWLILSIICAISAAWIGFVLSIWVSTIAILIFPH